MEALTSRLSFKGLLLAEVSLLISIELPNIPSPTTALPFRLPQFFTLPNFLTVQAVRTLGQTSVIFGSMRGIRSSPFTSRLLDRFGRIEFTIQLRTARSS